MLGAVEGEATELGVELGLDLHEARVGRRLLVEAVGHRGGGDAAVIRYLNIFVTRTPYLEQLLSWLRCLEGN